MMADPVRADFATRFQPGNRVNPGGRKKRKPFTAALERMLDNKATDKDGKGQNYDAWARRLHTIVLYGKDSDSLAAMKLAASYTQGPPTQRIELEDDRTLTPEELASVARQFAEAAGVDPGRLIARAVDIGRAAGVNMDSIAGKRVMPRPINRAV